MEVNEEFIHYRPSKKIFLVISAIIYKYGESEKIR